MTFASNDPAFRAAYSPTVFVGDRYTGDLAASELPHPDPPRQLCRRHAHLRRRRLAGPHQRAVPRADRPRPPTTASAPTGRCPPAPAPPATATGGPVITAPGAPTIGTATAGNATATVRWTAPTDDGGSGISGYSIQVLDNTETQVGALRTAAAGATSLVVTGLTNGTAYHFQVAATNTAGTGAYSASSNTVTPVATTAPGAPRSSATPSQGAAGGALDRHRPLDPTSQHRRLRHHRLPRHRPTDELQRRQRHRPVHAPTHPSSEPRSANAPSPSPPATTASKSSPSTPSAPAHPQPDPPTSCPADARRPTACCQPRVRPAARRRCVLLRAVVGQLVYALRASTRVCVNASRRSPRRTRPRPPVEFQTQPNHTFGVLSSASPTALMVWALKPLYSPTPRGRS